MMFKVEDRFPEYLEDLMTMLEDLSFIQVNQLRKPYQEMVWLLARVVGKESTATVPHLALYIFYFSIQEKVIFDWSEIISFEISFQLSNFRKNKKLFMFGYLIFAIAYCHVFEGLHLEKQVNCKLDLVHTWYPMSPIISYSKDSSLVHFSTIK